MPDSPSLLRLATTLAGARRDVLGIPLQAMHAEHSAPGVLMLTAVLEDIARTAQRPRRRPGRTEDLPGLRGYSAREVADEMLRIALEIDPDARERVIRDA